jgi:hypothetical protein
MFFRVADPHHFNANPDPSFPFDSDPDPTLAARSSSQWCKFSTTGLQTLHGSILNFRASIVSVHGPPWLHFELLKFEFVPDPGPVFCSSANPDPDQASQIMWIRIRNPAYNCLSPVSVSVGCLSLIDRRSAFSLLYVCLLFVFCAVR